MHANRPIKEQPITSLNTHEYVKKWVMEYLGMEKGHRGPGQAATHVAHLNVSTAESARTLGLKELEKVGEAKTSSPNPIRKSGRRDGQDPQPTGPVAGRPHGITETRPRDTGCAHPRIQTGFPWCQDCPAAVTHARRGAAAVRRAIEVRGGDGRELMLKTAPR